MKRMGMAALLLAGLTVGGCQSDREAPQSAGSGTDQFKFTPCRKVSALAFSAPRSKQGIAICMHIPQTRNLTLIDL